MRPVSSLGSFVLKRRGSEKVPNERFARAAAPHCTRRNVRFLEPYSAGWGYYPSGGIGIVLIIVLILVGMGRI